MDAIFLVLRSGCQWNALKETRICSSAHQRFQEWTKAGVFGAFWRGAAAGAPVGDDPAGGSGVQIR